MGGGGRRLVLWPAYFDSTLTRRLGRRVRKELSVPNPTLNEIKEALERLGLKYHVIDGRYPRVWWKYDKRIVVEVEMPKTRVIEIVARTLTEVRKSMRKT